MESAGVDPGVFIRSMATRGAHGGLATTTEEVADLLEAFGFERVLLETVGVGQTELDIARTAETTVLRARARIGRWIQALKAGVMEIADIYVVNKERPSGRRQVPARGRGDARYPAGERVSVTSPHTTGRTGDG